MGSFHAVSTERVVLYIEWDEHVIICDKLEKTGGGGVRGRGLFQDRVQPWL
jgi:hypothetical protein